VFAFGKAPFARFRHMRRCGTTSPCGRDAAVRPPARGYALLRRNGRCAPRTATRHTAETRWARCETTQCALAGRTER
jgi:hypothetical protein